MPIPPRVGDLEISQDLAHERRSWRVERIGWIVLALVVLAGLAGLAGSGPLSQATQAAPDGSFRVEYERFARMQAPSRLRVHFSEQALRAGEVRIWLERSYLEQAKLERVVPQPQMVEVGEERLTYVFAAPNARSGAVTFRLQLQSFGPTSGRVGVGQTALGFRQFVYP